MLMSLTNPQKGKRINNRTIYLFNKSMRSFLWYICIIQSTQSESAFDELYPRSRQSDNIHTSLSLMHASAGPGLKILCLVSHRSSKNRLGQFLIIQKKKKIGPLGHIKKNSAHWYNLFLPHPSLAKLSNQVFRHHPKFDQQGLNWA